MVPIETSKQVLENLSPQTGQEWIDRKYKGVQIKETQAYPLKLLSMLDQRFLVVSDNPKATESDWHIYWRSLSS